MVYFSLNIISLPLVMNKGSFIKIHQIVVN